MPTRAQQPVTKPALMIATTLLAIAYLALIAVAVIAILGADQ
jgi:hypothetical protein